MQALTTLTLLSLLVFSQSAVAQEGAVTRRRAPEASASRTYTDEESAALSRAARERTEAQDRDRDRRMKSTAKGICTGC
jgi:hypothetical protein